MIYFQEMIIGLTAFNRSHLFSNADKFRSSSTECYTCYVINRTMAIGRRADSHFIFINLKQNNCDFG